MADPKGLDITQLLTVANEFKVANDKATEGLVSNAARAEEITADNTALYSALGESAVIVQQVKDNAELKTQQNRLKVANNLGTNVGDSSELLTALSQTIHQEYQNRETALKAIEAKRSISLFDDPLGWINAQFDINDDIRAHNMADSRLSNAEKYYQDLNTLTQTGIATQNALKETVTQASIEASSEAIRQKAEIDANTARLQGLVYNSDGVKAALQGASNSFTIQRDIYGAQKQEQQINIALAQLENSRKDRADRLAAKGVEDASEAQLIAWINQGGKNRLGDSYIPLIPGTASAKNAIGLLKTNGPVGYMYNNDLLSGQTSLMIDPTGNHRQLATSPAHAIEMMSRDIPIKFSPAQKQVVELLNQARDNVAAAARMPGSTINPKDPKAYDAAVNAEVNRLVDEQAKKVSGPDNIFQVPAISTLLTNSLSGPKLANLPVVKKVLGPQMAAGNDLSDPNQVFGLVATAVANRTITYAEALDLTVPYAIGASANLEARQLTSLGITPRYGYRASITTDPLTMFSGKEAVDLTKPDALGRALNKYLAKEATKKVFEAVNPFALGQNLGAGFQTPVGPEITYPYESPSIYNRGSK